MPKLFLVSRGSAVCKSAGDTLEIVISRKMCLYGDSGGTQVTMSGRNLDAVGNPQIQLTVVEFTSKSAISAGIITTSREVIYQNISFFKHYSTLDASRCTPVASLSRLIFEWFWFRIKAYLVVVEKRFIVNNSKCHSQCKMLVLAQHNNEFSQVYV